MCGKPISTIELNSRVIAMTTGRWGEEDDILAIVEMDRSSLV